MKKLFFLAIAVLFSANVSLFAQPVKKVLLDEFTYATCGNCPDASLLVDSLNDYPNLISVAHHSGGTGTGDSMTVPESIIYADDFSFGAPLACVDRVKFVGETAVVLMQAKWREKVIQQLAVPAPVSVNISGIWNSTNRQMDIDIDAQFATAPTPGDMRINVFVVEDSVTGVGPGYDQINFYNAVVGHPYFGAGDPIVGYVHRHNLRAVLSGTWGTAGIIPQTPALLTDYSNSYNYTLQGNYNEDQIDIVAFVSYYDTSVAGRNVLNANQVHLSDLATGVDQASIIENNVNIFPNPAKSTFTISGNYELPAVIEMYNIIGEKVVSEKITKLNQKIDVNFLSEGMYVWSVGSARGKLVKE